MNTKWLILFFSLAWCTCFGQTTLPGRIDSLKQALALAPEDEDKVMILSDLSYEYLGTDMDSALLLAQQAHDLAQKINFTPGEARALFHLGHAWRILSDIPNSMRASLRGVQLAEENGFRQEAALCNYNIGALYLDLLNDIPKALSYLRKAGQWNAPVQGAIGESCQLSIYINFGVAYEQLNMPDSSAYYYNEALNHPAIASDMRLIVLNFMGLLQLNLKNYPEALTLLGQAAAKKINHRVSAEIYFNLASCFREIGQTDSCLFYAKNSLAEAEQIGYQKYSMKAATLIAEIYEGENNPEALRFYKIAKLAGDEVFGEQKVQDLQRIITDEMQRQQDAERERTAYENRVRQYALLGGLGGVLLIAFLLYRNNRQKQKSNAKLQAQNRELEIEAALERVRSRAMAMHKSEELGETIFILFNQLKELNIPLELSWVSLMDGEGNKMENWMTRGEGVAIPNTIYASDFVVFERNLEAWKQGKDAAVPVPKEKAGEIVRKFFHLELDLPEHATFFHVLNFWHRFGFIGLGTFEDLQEEERQIVKRFAKVFEQTYTRFLDLQRAEAQAREAKIEAGLERVRAEIASMRRPEDLQHITPLVWRELTVLEVPFFRCGVFIIDETAERVHAYLSTPEGKPLGALHLPFDGAETTRKTVDHWRRGDVYTDFWDRLQFLDWVRSMTEQGFVRESATYQGGDEPPESLALQFVPFTQGMLYVGSPAPLPDEQINLLQRLADAFAVAYARYEDFTNLEQAKNRIESTLTELKTTQAQLIQSEKLASLGELTAGIAHEIQNPLNFVNNFAEVSTDLVGEMEDELKQGQTEEAVAIAADLKQNLAKIHHHGQRASGIVKSMLQHSRASKGEKEPTDLNALADEYLRLAYHGLRAKDHSFNCKMETHFDPDLPAADVAPQDIGRVLLNLIGNAFHATQEKAKMGTDGYEPTVTVSSKIVDGHLELRVQDNGPGIPEAIREKIFQPFFTTKPTGHGTGLGLSLAYDMVVKGHGGMLEVSTQDGEGTTFIIRLPGNQIQ